MHADEALAAQHAAFGDLGISEIAVVKNPDYVFSPVELYPLAPKSTRPLPRIAAAVMDMDGTTTTTEPLCIHSQEYMLRRITGLADRERWSGLDPAEDYPNIIGNSTTKHLEYLIGKYGPLIRTDKLLASFFEAVLSTHGPGRRFGRWGEVLLNAAALGPAELVRELENLPAPDPGGEWDFSVPAGRLLEKYRERCRTPDFDMTVRMAGDIYYARYHRILSRLEAGLPVADAFLPDPGQSLIEPMPGIAFFLSLLKGFFDESDADALYDSVLMPLARQTDLPRSPEQYEVSRRKLRTLVGHIRNNPVKIALVTSSIGSEAEIVLTEVMKAVRKEIASWPLGDGKKENLVSRFDGYRNVYDAVVTADDSSEIRLKPHRDLYAIALYRLAVKKEDYRFVMGFEDSESGIIAIRAAGIGCSVALPFRHTENHRFWAASHVLPGAIPELILRHGCLLDAEGNVAVPR